VVVIGLLIGSVLAIAIADVLGLITGVGLSAYLRRRCKKRVENEGQDG
jgi:uncharacterized protein (DUF2062 family)